MNAFSHLRQRVQKHCAAPFRHLVLPEIVKTDPCFLSAATDSIEHMFATTVDSTANWFESIEMMVPGPELATALAGVNRVPQRRHITARYRRCVWPGCRMPSVDCDVDHRVPHADGGCTHDHNLAPVCRHHHRIRHQARWNYERLASGDHEWRSPLGRTYTTSGRSP